jgi:hypothetical protein
MSEPKSDDELREMVLQAIMTRRGCDRDEAKIISRRIGDRLDGYTHDEAVERNPLPTRDGGEE